MQTQRRKEKRVGERASAWGRPWPFNSSFDMFFLPLGLPYVNWASQECCLLPEVLTLVLGPSFVLFSWAFPSLVF